MPGLSVKVILTVRMDTEEDATVGVFRERARLHLIELLQSNDGAWQTCLQFEVEKED